MFKKEFIIAGILGLITAFFATPILYYSNDNSWTIVQFGFSFSIWWLYIILPLADYIGYLVAAKLFAQLTGLKQLARFGVTGLMNFSVDTGIVTALTEWYHIDPESKAVIPFLVISSTFAIINSYYWQRSWTFGQQNSASQKEFIGFVLVTVVGIAINTAIAFLSIQVISSMGVSNNAQLITLSKIVATIISLFWNFFGYKFFVFGK